MKFVGMPYKSCLEGNVHIILKIVVCMFAKVMFLQPITNQTYNFCDCAGKLSRSNNKKKVWCNIILHFYTEIMQ
jgi:hypothetical protein